MFGFFIIFSFKAIFKLKIIWQHIIQNFEFIIFLVVSGFEPRTLHIFMHCPYQLS